MMAENSPRSLKNPEINPVLYSGQTGPITAPLILSNLRSTNIHQAPSSSSDFFFFLKLISQTKAASLTSVLLFIVKIVCIFVEAINFQECVVI